MNFKLTIRKPENLVIRDPKNLTDDWNKMLYSIMSLLHSQFDLQDEEDLCNISLADYLTEKELKNLTVCVCGADWQSQVKFIGELVLIGDHAGKNYDYCKECGHPDVQIVGNYIECNHCKFTECITDDIPMDEDINDFGGRIDLGTQIY